MAEVHLPVVGAVSKKALVIGGGGAAAVVLLVFLRKRAQAPAAAPGAAGDTSAADGTGTDGSGDYVDPGLQDTANGPDYGATGYYDPNSGQWLYGNSGTAQAAATTNQQWAQLAEQYLITNNAADPGALSTAIGKYLTGQAVTTDQESLIDQAIAIEGYPPVGGFGGYPPGIRTASSSGSGGSGGGGGGGGSNVVGQYPAPKGLKLANVTTTSARIDWDAVSPKPPSYTVEVGSSKKTTSATSFTITGLQPGHRYAVKVWANGGRKAPPHASLTFGTHKK